MVILTVVDGQTRIPHAHAEGNSVLTMVSLVNTVVTAPREVTAMPANDKRCRKCGQTKPIRFFTLPRHRMCTRCRSRGNYDFVDDWLANQPARPPPVPPSAAEVWAAEQAHGPLPPGTPIPKLTMTWDGYKKYERERQRQIRREKEQEAALSQPVRTPVYRKIKLCVRCRERKHVTMFRNPRYRLCMKCDGPPIT